MTDENRQTFYPLINYSDPAKAMQWLEAVFGFTPHEVHQDESGRIAHAEMRFGTGTLMLTQAETGNGAVHVAVDDPDAHHDRARAAGAEITAGLTDQSYGSRDYAARDLEGNDWYFGTYRP